MEKEKASAKRMKVGGERKHLKSILFIQNVTRGGDWFASRYAWQEALASEPGGVRGPSFSALHLLWAAIWFRRQYRYRKSSHDLVLSGDSTWPKELFSW